MSTLIEQIAGQYYMMGDAAHELGVTRMTLWRWMRAKELTGHRLGREVFIEKSEIERLKSERQTK